MLAQRSFAEKGGTGLFKWGGLICGVLIGIGPASLTAQVNGRALLHTDGATLLNGSPAPATTAIFANALIQTPKLHIAKIDADGSTVLIQPETIVQFDGEELVLDHGSLQLSTLRGLRVRVNCITIIPLTLEQTQYDVTDVDGKVRVDAYKNDVKIHLKGGTAIRSKEGKSSDLIVREGERSSRSEKCAAAIKPDAVVDAKGAALNSWWARATGVGAIAVIACLGLCHSDDPVSPSTP